MLASEFAKLVIRVDEGSQRLGFLPLSSCSHAKFPGSAMAPIRAAGANKTMPSAYLASARSLMTKFILKG